MLRLLVIFLILFGFTERSLAFWQTRDSNYNVLVSGGGGGAAAIAGPGDSTVAGSAVAFWATFSCYTSTYAGHTMDVGTSTTLPATGSRVDCNGAGTAAAITGSTCTFVSGNTCSPLATTCASLCVVVKLYDQTGANSCSSNPCDLVPTGSFAPTLSLSSLNGFPCLTSASSANSIGAANSLTQGQAFTLLMTSVRNSGTADLYAVMRDTASAAGTIRFGYTNSANKADIYNGNSIPSGVTASDTHFHTLGGVFNNASSAIYVDGSGTTGINLGGTGGFGTAPAIFSATANTTAATICEGGIWNTDIGSTKNSNYNTNAVARYGSFP